MLTDMWAITEYIASKNSSNGFDVKTHTFESKIDAEKFYYTWNQYYKNTKERFIERPVRHKYFNINK